MTKGVSGRRSEEPAPRPVYDASYYHEHLGGVSYEDEEHWTQFFGGVAVVVARDIAPKTALDVGCATGYLVEALRERGIEAWGIDVSEYALQHIRPAARGYCHVASILEPFPQRYDLITCVEVVEHLQPEEAGAAVANLCKYSDDILFTSTPSDFHEETHFNVRPPEYWTELFARHEFYRDVEFEIPELAVWAGRYRRRQDPFHRIVAAYERELWRHRLASNERNKLIMEQRQRVEQLADEKIRLTRERGDSDAAVERAEQQLARVHDDLAQFTESASGRMILGLQSLARRLATPGTVRGRAVHGFAKRFAGLLDTSRKRRSH
jgi:SAM-dependent methyltransferase